LIAHRALRMVRMTASVSQLWLGRGRLLSTMRNARCAVNRAIGEAGGSGKVC
jgi:hypothetical protein